MWNNSVVVTRPQYYRIKLKRIPGKYRSYQPLPVTRYSPLKLRKEVEAFAIYFKREFDYAIREFDAREKDPYTAYLFPDPHAMSGLGPAAFDRRAALMMWTLRRCGGSGFIPIIG